MIIVSLAKLLFDGGVETFFAILAPAIFGFLVYCQRNLNFLWMDEIEHLRKKRSHQREKKTYMQARATLVEMKENSDINSKRKKEYDIKIAELDELFAGTITDRIS